VTAPLTGYADRISVRAGETIAFKVSSHGSGPFSANLVRIVCGDPNPAGPGPTFEDQSTAFAGRFPSRAQHAWPGSYAIVDGAKAITLPQALSVEALIWPTLATDGPQTVLSRRDPRTGAGFALVLTPEGMTLEVGDAKVAVGKPMRLSFYAYSWYFGGETSFLGPFMAAPGGEEFTAVVPGDTLAYKQKSDLAVTQWGLPAGADPAAGVLLINNSDFTFFGLSANTGGATRETEATLLPR